MKTLRYAIYVRVSTDEQAKEGHSIEAQLKKLRAFVVSQDGEIPDNCEYVEDGYSAKNMDRPSMKRLFADAEAGKFNIVLVNCLDRWSRSLKDLLNSIDRLNKMNVFFKSATESIGTATPQEKLMFNILGSFGQFEREINGERTRMSLVKRFQEGRHNTVIMMGYDFEGKKKESRLVINPKEAEIVKFIFRTYLEREIGLKALVNLMNERGMKTKSGRQWDVKKAYKTITNPIYCGFVRYRDQINKGIHQPIISEEEFNQVKAKLTARGRHLNIYNRQMKGRAYPICNHSENILSGLVFCGKCGHLLGKSTGKRWRYYQCNAKKVNKACDQKNVRADILENLVLKKIYELGHDKTEIERIRAEFFSGNLKKLEKIDADILANRDEIAGFNHRIDKTMNWIMETNTPVKIDSVSVMEEINKMKARVKELQDQVYVREMEAASIQVKDIIFSQTEEYLKNFKLCYEAKSHEDKRLLLQSVVEKVIVNSFQDIKVRLTLPLFTKEGSHHDVLVRPLEHNKNTRSIPVQFRLNLQFGLYDGAFDSNIGLIRFRASCQDNLATASV